jgi:hypothetical protein
LQVREATSADTFPLARLAGTQKILFTPAVWSQVHEYTWVYFFKRSTFGSEFIAMKQSTEYVRGLRYKLRMMGIKVDEPAFMFGDNQSVLCNTTAPASTLKKKSNAIAYHFVREGVARDEWRTAYVNTDENLADLLTKPLSGPKQAKFVRMVLRHFSKRKGMGI